MHINNTKLILRRHLFWKKNQWIMSWKKLLTFDIKSYFERKTKESYLEKNQSVLIYWLCLIFFFYAFLCLWNLIIKKRFKTDLITSSILLRSVTRKIRLRHECHMSVTQMARVQHECCTSSTRATRV